MVNNKGHELATQNLEAQMKQLHADTVAADSLLKDTHACDDVTPAALKQNVESMFKNVNTQNTEKSANKTSVAGNEIVALTRLSSRMNSANNHQLMFDNKKILLRAGAAPFELVLFDKKTKMAVVRKIDKNLRHKLFIIKCNDGIVAEEMKMGARDIKYIPSTRQILAREAVDAISRYIAFKSNGQIEMTKFPSSDALSVVARQASIKETLVIEEDGTVNAYQLMNLSDPTKAPVKIGTKVAAPQGAPAQMPAPRPQEPQPKPTQRDGELRVSVKPIKRSLDGVYSDVTVNGQRILHDHIDTKLQLFLGGTVLGIYGIVTDNPDLPTKPMWQVYNTELKPRQFQQRNIFTKKLVYIEHIQQLGEDRLILDISNKMRVIMEKRNADVVFRIIEKTK